MKPLARKSGIFAENLPEEVVLYDKTHDKVHCLNKTAAAVWENSDGSKTVDELTRAVEAKSGAPTDRKLVLQALEELEEAGLLEAGSGIVSEAGLPSRREAVGKMVMAGSALVATIVAAAPKAHASSSDPPKGGDPPALPNPHNPPPDPLPPVGYRPPSGGHKKP
jgi:coenzyme PQQ synthesis protein D (PqqD)